MKTSFELAQRAVELTRDISLMISEENHAVIASTLSRITAAFIASYDLEIQSSVRQKFLDYVDQSVREFNTKGGSSSEH